MEDVLSLKILGSHSVCVHSTPVTYALWKCSYVGIYDVCVFTESSKLVLGVCNSLYSSLERVQTTKTVSYSVDGAQREGADLVHYLLCTHFSHGWHSVSFVGWVNEWAIDWLNEQSVQMLRKHFRFTLQSASTAWYPCICIAPLLRSEACLPFWMLMLRLCVQNGKKASEAWPRGLSADRFLGFGICLVKNQAAGS